MKKIFFIHIAILLLLFGGCNNPSLEEIEHSIQSKVLKEAPHLANLEATYATVFSNHDKNWIFEDDLYLRKDEASVFYGYNLEKANIHVMQEDNRRILKVELPVPKQISIDRTVKEIHKTNELYNPIDADGNPINVDKMINEDLQALIEHYEEQTIEHTRMLSQQYFSAIAAQYGLELEISFQTFDRIEQIEK